MRSQFSYLELRKSGKNPGNITLVSNSDQPSEFHHRGTETRRKPALAAKTAQKTQKNTRNHPFHFCVFLRLFAAITKFGFLCVSVSLW